MLQCTSLEGLTSGGNCSCFRVSRRRPRGKWVRIEREVPLETGDQGPQSKSEAPLQQSSCPEEGSSGPQGGISEKRGYPHDSFSRRMECLGKIQCLSTGL